MIILLIIIIYLFYIRNAQVTVEELIESKRRETINKGIETDDLCIY